MVLLVGLDLIGGERSLNDKTFTNVSRCKIFNKEQENARHEKITFRADRDNVDLSRYI